MLKKTARELLGLGLRYNAAELKLAYRRAAAVYHPDRNGCAELFKDITTAYQLLSDERPDLQDADSVNEQRITITVQEAFDGGVVETPLGDIEIPPGTRPGDRVGSIYVNIELCGMRVEWEGKSSGDIRQDMSVTALRCMLGGWATVSTLDGRRVRVRIPAGMTAGAPVKVLGGGYWRDQSCRTRGDLYLFVQTDNRRIEEYSKEERHELREALARCD